MRCFLLGATGRTGGAFLRRALAHGHHVTAFVRDAAKLDLVHPHLTVAVGDVRDGAALKAAMAQGGPYDAVVSCLGAARSGETRDVVSVGGLHALAAMAENGVERVLLLSVAGLLDGDDGRLRRDAPTYPASFRAGSAAHLVVYEALQASSFDWTLFCPPELIPGEPEGPVRVRVDVAPEGPKRVRIESLVGVMLDALEQGRYRRQRVGVCDEAPGS